MTDQSEVLEGRLAAMQGTLRSLLLAVQSMADSEGGDFAEPSPARTEWSALESPLGSDLRQTYETGMVLWHSVLDHGRGLADLIGRRRTYSVMTAARALAEAAARSWECTELGVDPARRVQRLLNERLFANFENVRLLESLLTETGRAARDADVDIDDTAVRDRLISELAVGEGLRAQVRGYGLRVRKVRGVPAVGSGRASSMSVLERMLGDRVASASFYRMNSSIAHTALHGQVRMIEMTVGANDKNGSRPVAMHPDDLAAQAAPAVQAVAVAAETLFLQAGWAPAGLASLLTRVREVWDAPPDDELFLSFDALV